MAYQTNYLALNYREPGKYIPKHDSSFTNETEEKAVAEARHDLVAHSNLKEMAVYKLVAVVTKDTVERV
jgi:hypothetical protein